MLNTLSNINDVQFVYYHLEILKYEIEKAADDGYTKHELKHLNQVSKFTGRLWDNPSDPAWGELVDFQELLHGKIDKGSAGERFEHRLDNSVSHIQSVMVDAYTIPSPDRFDLYA